MSDPKTLSPEQQALLAIRALRRRVEELEGAAAEPIALVGMACRFPGGTRNPDEYWEFLLNRRDAVREIPRERIDLEGIYEPYPPRAGKSYSRWAALVANPDHFDSEFFGISPREAIEMDPQHRLLLEVSWEAFEDAGIDPRSLAGQSGGCFVGISISEYSQRARQLLPLEQLSAYAIQGAALNAAAGRLAYFYGLHGPAIAIDSACSSSLVAVDRACRSLRDRECQIALAAGVNVLADPGSLVIGSQWGMLSPTGKVRAFSGEADGFVRGEGCGVVVLKRLREAEAGGDRVLGVILGSAVNQDGASSGLTVPNGLAQQALLREAHRRAGIEARQVGYVEAHGTGTALGDPIEAEALGAVFAGRERKLAIGSVKTNIGHLEAGAGIAGLIKVVLGLQHGVIPAQLHFSEPSRHVRWEELALEVVTEAREWEAIEGRRIGGVSSFGFSGTNAHVVVEGWSGEPEEEEEGQAQAEVLVITARNRGGLRELAQRYAEYLGKTEAGWWGICETAQQGRAVFGERLAVVAEGTREAAEKLRAWLAGEPVRGVYEGHVGAGHRHSGKALETEADVEGVAEQFVKGGGVDWKERRGGRKGRRVGLPTYAFQRERYWIEERGGVEQSEGAEGGRLLGRKLEVAGVGGQWETKLRESGWVSEHRVEGEAVLPATGHVELMLEASAALRGRCAKGAAVEEVAILARLSVVGERRVQTVVEEQTGGRQRVRVYAEKGAEWEPVSEGWLSGEAREAGRVDVEQVRGRLKQEVGRDVYYQAMGAQGMRLEGRFRGVRAVWKGEGEALGEIEETEAGEESWEIAPWWLDGCLQVVGAAAGKDELILPVGLERVEVYGKPGPRSWSHVRTRWINQHTLLADVDIARPDGSIIARVSALKFRRAGRSTVPAASLYRINWYESALIPQRCRTPEIKKRVLIIGELVPASKLASLFEKSDCLATQVQYERLNDNLREELYDAVIWTASSSRRASSGQETPLFPTEPSIGSLLETAQALARHRTPGRLYVLTANACPVLPGQTLELAASPLHGMAAAIAMELPDLRCTRLDGCGEDADLSLVVSEVLGDALDRLVAWRGAKRFVPKIQRESDVMADPEESSNARLQTTGGIDGLFWKTVSARDLGPHEVEIAVRATALNFHEVLQALGVIQDDGPLGTDCSGVVRRIGEAVTDLSPGDEVAAFAPGCFARHAITQRSLVVPKPKNLSFSQVSAQIVAYLTAAHCLEEVAQLRPGQTVLVHAAAGGVGLAAVHLSRKLGARVIATAGSTKKREYLKSLGVDEVYNSRNLDFATQIVGKVDVVLNSLAGEAIDAGLALLKEGGCFVELGRTDLRDAGRIAAERPSLRYVPVELASENDPAWTSRRLDALFSDFSRGALPPLPVTVFPANKVRDAFRLMARAAHIGRVVVTQKDFSGAHLVTGGLGGIGLKVAEWLARCGANRLILVGRSAPGSTAKETIDKLGQAGIAVEILQGDIGDPQIAERAVRSAGANLRGIWHAAGVIENLAIPEQTPESMRRALRGKAEGAWNLHCAASGLELDYFVLFSSWATIAGSHGQVNYGAANAFLDALAHYRQAQGQPGVSVNWGAWRQTGAAAQADVQRQLSRAGMESMSPDDALQALRQALSLDVPQIAIGAIQWARYMTHQPERNRDPFYADFSRSPTPSREIEERPDNTLVQRESALLQSLTDAVRRILDLNPGEEIDPNMSLRDLGMDSLLAMELNNSLASAMDRQLPSTLLFDYPTLRALAGYFSPEAAPVRSRRRSEDSKIGERSGSLDLLSSIEQMTEEDINAVFEQNSRS
jgi:acyl transferase domain-containing protein/acyl carrier protein